MEHLTKTQIALALIAGLILATAFMAAGYFALQVYWPGPIAISM